MRKLPHLIKIWLIAVCGLLQATLAWSKNSNSLVDADGRILIPEVMALRSNGIPDSLFERYDSTIIAESLVARLARNRIRPAKSRLNELTPRRLSIIAQSPATRGGFFALNIPTHEREIHIYRTAKHLRGIVTTGLLNYHQTGTTSLNADRERRCNAENAFSELRLVDPASPPPPEAKVNFLLPKCGVFEVTSEFGFGDVVNSANDQLGGVTAVLKAHTHRRATYTVEDSLLLYDGSGRAQTARELKTTLRPLSEEQLYLATPSSYFEAQVWGEVALRDIQEWRVSSDITRAQIEILMTTGIPIYRYETDSFPHYPEDADMFPGARNYRARKKLIYAGNPRLMKKYEDELKTMRAQAMRTLSRGSKPCSRRLNGR